MSAPESELTDEELTTRLTSVKEDIEALRTPSGSGFLIPGHLINVRDTLTSELARRSSCICGASLANTWVSMGLCSIDDVDASGLCNSCWNSASKQTRVDDDLDKYGYEDNWSDL